MELFILIIQISLAILMGYYAVPKLIFSKETLKAKGGEKMDYVDNLSSFSLVVIGLIELFTALGLILSGFMVNVKIIMSIIFSRKKSKKALQNTI